MIVKYNWIIKISLFTITGIFVYLYEIGTGKKSVCLLAFKGKLQQSHNWEKLAPSAYRHEQQIFNDGANK